MAETGGKYRLCDVWCLLTPGLNWYTHDGTGLHGMLVPRFDTGGIDVALFMYPAPEFYGPLLTREEIENGSYRDIFAVRLKGVIEQVRRANAEASI